MRLVEVFRTYDGVFYTAYIGAEYLGLYSVPLPYLELRD